MRYILETIKQNVRQAQAVTVVERVFVNAGSRQYNTVECDILPVDFRGRGHWLGTGLHKLMKSTHQNSLSILK